MLDWIKKGFSANDGSMDDARVAAALIVVTFVGMAIYGVVHNPPTTPADFGEMLEKYGVGAAAMAGGIGMWFGMRKDN
jgi:hypothetical protein